MPPESHAKKLCGRKRGGAQFFPTRLGDDGGERSGAADSGDLDEITAVASRNEIELAERIAMPANNLSAVFRRR